MSRRRALLLALASIACLAAGALSGLGLGIAKGEWR
jgi:hypothetical protein